jgi:2,3-bisphosphoglycerate-independent phosphoglycerate mutase
MRRDTTISVSPDGGTEGEIPAPVFGCAMDAALVVLDGWGLAPSDQVGRDAVTAAETSVVDRLWAGGASGRLQADGRTVGLPDGQMGNSEVGHLTIGAGRPVEQAYTRIEDAVAEGTLAARSPLSETLERVKTAGRRLHLIGLVSDGGVHGDHTHLHALIQAAAEREVPTTTHAITDGRDTAPTAGEGFIAELERVAADAGTGQLASVSGRYYAMDRDQNWSRTYQAYEAIVRARADTDAPSGVAAVQAGYDRGETDEFLSPSTVAGGRELEDGDAVMLCNFRADRSRQLTRMLADIEPVWSPATNPPDIEVLTMTEYDRTFDLPVVFEPIAARATLGSVLAESGRTQLRVAESEKYAHVTYFFNGGREVEFPGEQRRIIPSPDVPTYDVQPEMNAAAVTDTTLDVIDSDDPDVLVLNYANPDMVGHTGDYEAAVTAVEAVDEEVGRLVPALQAAGAHTIVTADHGNAENMGTPDNPHTAHTTNPVPVIYVPPGETATGRTIRMDGTLADLTPTLLSMLEEGVPDEMTGRSLLTST